MTPSISDRRVASLGRRVLPRHLTEADGALLNAMLESDAEPAQFYNNYMFLHAELYTQHASVGLRERGARIEERESEFDPHFAPRASLFRATFLAGHRRGALSASPLAAVG